MKNREENSITAIVTDPPYGVKEYTEEELKKEIERERSLLESEEQTNA